MYDHRETVRVLLVSPLPPPPGGIATWTQILLRELTKHPNVRIKHIDVAVRWRTSTSLIQSIRVVGRSLQAIRDTIRIGIAMMFFRPHVLHLTTSAGYASLKDALVLMLARLFGVSGLIHYRTSEIGLYENIGDWKLHAAIAAMRFASIVVVLDNRTYAFLQKVFPSNKVVKIVNMIDLDEIDGLVKKTRAEFPNESNGNNPRLVFVGRAVPEKGLVEQVAACVQLPSVHLHVVGPVDETFQKKLGDIARSREGGAWLHFHGGVDNDEACRQLLCSDIFLLPSLYEAFPNALLEAMALAKPVIVSDVGEMPDMIDAKGENSCGLCVPAGNTDSLRFALKQILEEPELRHVMGQRGRKRVELLYSTDTVVKRLICLWEDAMSSRSNSSVVETKTLE